MRSRTIAAALALVAIAANCGPPAGQATAPDTASLVTVTGSDTMVHLVTTWAEAYMDAQPAADISVTGGGSGAGIAALLNGNTDLCASSRDMSHEEKELARQKNLGIQEYAVARDGIAVIVNPASPVATLTMEQIKKIYTGAVTDWSEVGAATGEIVLLSRESSSGTYVFFQEHVLEKEDFAPGARLMPATSAIIQSVADDAQAIGYVGLGYAQEAGARVKVIPIKTDDNAPAVEPTPESVRSGAYALSRPLYYYAAAPIAPATAGFIEFCLSPPGQKIVQEIGYVPVN